jgi:vancomycin resistance protein YoaR
MDNKTRINQGLKLFIIFLIPLVIISNISMIISNQVNANDKLPSIMTNDYSVAGISLAEMTKEEAAEAIEQAIAGIDNKDIIIKIDEQEWAIPVKALELQYNVFATIEEAFSLTSTSSRNHIPLVFKYNRDFLRMKLLSIAEEVEIPAVNAKVSKIGNRIEKAPEQVGMILAIDNAILAVQNALASGLPSSDIIISLTEKIPNILLKDIREVNKHFASFSTRVEPEENNRIHNIERAVELIDAVVIKPNEVYSFNKSINPYTIENGYIAAPVISAGTYTEGIGGGVCQVSTTMFVASMKGGLGVTEHYNHARPVNYVPLGHDATVSSAEDLKLINNNGKNVYLAISYNDYNITVDVYGNESDYMEYTLETKNKKQLNPDTLYHLDNNLSPYAEQIVEQGEYGYTIDLYRTWREGSTNQQELIKNYTYPPLPKVITVGTKHRKANETPEGKNNSGKPVNSPTSNGQLG